MKRLRISHIDLLFLAWLALVLWAFNGYISLWDQDEAAYAGFAKRMLEGGHYIIPDFTWSEIHRKPPLHFWLISVAYRLFGLNTFAVRFFAALAVWGSVVLIRFRGEKLLGVTYARLAAFFMAGNAFVVMLGKMAVTDGLLLLFYTWAGLALACYLIKDRRKALIEFYVALALGALVKGPPIILWAGFLWLLLLIFYPGRRKLIRMHPWIWGLLALVPFGLWIYAAWQQHPDFVRWWFDWYVLRRTHSAVINQTGPPGYYLALFFLFGLAYLPLIGLTFKWMIKNLRNASPLARYVILWFVAGWLPYELLPSKLPSYVLASYPALALAAGMAFKDYEQGRLTWTPGRWRWAQTILFALLAVGAAAFLLRPGSSLPEAARAPLLLTALLSLYMTYASWRNGGLATSSPGKALRLYLVQALAWISGLYLIVLPLAEPLKNATWQTARLIARQSPDAKEIVVLNHFAHPPSLPFYLEKYNPQARLIMGGQSMLKELNRNNDSLRVWILSRRQWEQLAPEIRDHYEKYEVKSLNTGAVGQNDYIILWQPKK